MEIKGWRYYNKAAIPSCAPHEAADLSPVSDGSIWKLDGGPLFARWTSDYDCGRETQWWYVIKDTPMDLPAMKSTYRYRINRGRKFFDCSRIDPAEYEDGIYAVMVKACEGFPAKYRPDTSDRKKVLEGLLGDEGGEKIFYASFDKEDGAMVSFLILVDKGSFYDFIKLRTVPETEAKDSNAAIIACMLDDVAEDIASGKYVCDGERNTLHETNFAYYLETVFGFRKAYCRLNMRYRGMMKAAVSLLYPLRKTLEKSESPLIAKASAVLKMEEIRRSFGG